MFPARVPLSSHLQVAVFPHTPTSRRMGSTAKASAGDGSANVGRAAAWLALPGVAGGLAKLAKPSAAWPAGLPRHRRPVVRRCGIILPRAAGGQ